MHTTESTVITPSLLNYMAIPRTFAFLLLVVAPLCCTAASILYSGESLKSGESLSLGSYQLIMQKDCNLVLYDTANPIWASDTSGRANNCYATLLNNGNLVIYKNNATPLWTSQTNKRQGHYVLILQKDRNAVIYGGPCWATNTYVGVSGAIIINSKASILGALPANNTTEEAKAAVISMVVNN